MKTIELHGEYLERFLRMDPFGQACVLGLRGSFALGTTMEQEDGTDKPAALVIVSEEDDRLVINWLYVRPEYRGLSLGSRLMQLVFEEAVARGVSEVCARITDEFEESGVDWNTDSFFVNEVFKDLEVVLSEIRFTMKDLARILDDEAELNEEAASDKSVLPIGVISEKDKQIIIEKLNDNFDVQLSAEAGFLFSAGDENMSFVMVKDGEVRGAIFTRKTGNTWYIYSLVAKEPSDAERLIRTAMYHGEDYAKMTDVICIQPQRKESISLVDKLGIKYSTYGIHYISASVADYKKQKKAVDAEWE